MRDWCIVWVSIAIIPLTLILDALTVRTTLLIFSVPLFLRLVDLPLMCLISELCLSFQISLGWVYLFMGVVIGSAVIPISLSIFWGRLTGYSMVAGACTGTLLGLISWLITASTYEGGLSNFIDNTGTFVLACAQYFILLYNSEMKQTTRKVAMKRYISLIPNFGFELCFRKRRKYARRKSSVNFCGWDSVYFLEFVCQSKPLFR